MFNYRKLNTLNELLSKKAQFVPIDSSAGDGMPPPGSDPSMMGGTPPPGVDTSMMGGMPPPGVDPSMMGGTPPPPGVDPSMMGGMPPPVVDPSMMGGVQGDQQDVSPTGEPYMKITPTQLSKLFKQFAEVFKSVLGVQDNNSLPQCSQRGIEQDSALADKIQELDTKIDSLLR